MSSIRVRAGRAPGPGDRTRPGRGREAGLILVLSGKQPCDPSRFRRQATEKYRFSPVPVKPRAAKAYLRKPGSSPGDPCGSGTHCGWRGDFADSWRGKGPPVRCGPNLSWESMATADRSHGDVRYWAREVHGQSSIGLNSVPALALAGWLFTSYHQHARVEEQSGDVPHDNCLRSTGSPRHLTTGSPEPLSPGGFNHL
jgi:hypothetical protein